MSLMGHDQKAQSGCFLRSHLTSSLPFSLPCTSLLKLFTAENFESLSSPSLPVEFVSSGRNIFRLSWLAKHTRFSSWKKEVWIGIDQRVAGYDLSMEQSLGLSHVRHSGPPHAGKGAAVTKELERSETPFQLMSSVPSSSFSSSPTFFYNGLVPTKHWSCTLKVQTVLMPCWIFVREWMAFPSTKEHQDNFSQPGPELRSPHTLFYFLSHSSAITAAPTGRRF